MPLAKLIIVAGMHRAGTSAITGVLEGLGAALGDSLASAHPGINDMGYKEDVEVIDIHEDLLWSLPSSWDDILPVSYTDIASVELSKARLRIEKVLAGYQRKSHLSAVKDPRICLFLPLWLEACQHLGIEPLILIPSRHPDSVAQSLHIRDGISHRRAKLLWIKYFLDAERYSRGVSRCFLSYEELLSAPDRAIDQFVVRLGIPVAPDAAANAKSFINPALNRSHSKLAGMPSGDWIDAHASQLYRAMNNNEHLSKDEFLFEFSSVKRAYRTFFQDADTIFLDQCNANITHAADFRRYWKDAMNSKTFKMLYPFRNLLRRSSQHN